MVPVTLEGCGPVSEGGGARGGSISLSMLIDFIVQRTYHELTVLAELLPRKTDMERKIEIYKLSARNRQLFVRLLALVKWAGSASKVDRSAHIMGFLDKQAMLFVDTADMLARMARETLVHARLPTFHIPAAVEVLTQGTYARLPACIRERLVPPEGLTPTERRATLRALNHVIRQRLVGCYLPDNMRTFKVENGRVTFQIAQEFSVSLTLMGDSLTLPWRLLDVAILVQDNEIGEGKPLVHPRQVAYIRSVAQTRLALGGGPAALLAVVAYFCRSLQLELLYTQTLRLARDRLGKHVQVDQYVPGRTLTVSYWRELGCELGYRVTIQAEATSPGKSLAAVHIPQLGSEQEAAAAKALSAQPLSMERLLVTVIHVRSRARLGDLKTLLTQMGIECTLGGSPCTLACSLLLPCLRAEQLLVAVGVHCGQLRCHVPQYPKAPISAALPAALAAAEVTKLVPLLADLRYWLMARRCEKTLQHLPAHASEHLPLIVPPGHLLERLSAHRIYVTLHKHPEQILVVEMVSDGRNGVKLYFYLAGVTRCGPEEEEHENEHGSAFMKITSLVRFDTFVATHGPFTTVDPPGLSGKRRATASGRAVRPKQPAYFLPELAHIVAAADERVPFVHLARELSKREICHGGIQVECGGSGPTLRVISLPCPEESGVPREAAGALVERLLSAAIRIQLRSQAKVWTAELAFYSSPLRSQHPKEQGFRRCVYFQYEMGTEGAEKAAEAFLADWCTVMQLHSLVYHYMQHDPIEREAAEAHVSIVSYDYRRLVLGAGPGGRARCTVTWSGGQLRLQPAAAPGAANAHALIHHQLESFLNKTQDLLQLMAALKETYAPLVALGRLTTIPHLGLQNSRPQVPVQIFTLIPQSWRKIHVAYQGSYCLEVAVRGGGVIAIRDGAYSRFNSSAVIGEFTPTPGLKGFLSLYVSESGARVVSEDDNPPSPISPRDSSASGSGSLLRFPAPLTPPAPHTPHSAPHTPHPASPHQGHSGSFNLTSPPMGSVAHASPASPQHPGASPLPSIASASPGPAYIPPGSPFTAWPGSPSVPRPSPARSQVPISAGRVLVGGRAWAGAVATLLQAGALEVLCTPCEPPPGASGPMMAPLERFLGCVYMRRHLQRFIQQEDSLTLVTCSEPGVVVFRAETGGVTGRVALHPVHMQSLHLSLTPLPDHKDQWTPEELKVIERYFELRVVCPPYKPNSLWGWGRCWGAPPGVFRDLVQLMRRELSGPGVCPNNMIPWSVQWALRIPPQAAPIIPTAHPGVVLAKNKILIFLCLTQGESQVVLPLVYDAATNITQLAEKRDPNAHLSPASLQYQACTMLKRFADYNTNRSECSLWLAIRDLLNGLNTPQEVPPQHPALPPPP